MCAETSSRIKKSLIILIKSVDIIHNKVYNKDIKIRNTEKQKWKTT
nr:MAG TPA: hypothetical protein [Caudoviricetes sp.]